MLDFIFTIISVGTGLFFGTMLVDWYGRTRIEEQVRRIIMENLPQVERARPPELT